MRFLFFIIAIHCCMLSLPAHAGSNDLDFAAFARIPVLHEGRVKPMDTLARTYLYRLHDCQTVDGMSASEWLAQSIFKPDVAAQHNFIHVPDARIASALELPYKKGQPYSLNQLTDAYLQKRDVIIALIRKGEKNLGKYEQEFLDFYSLINDYSHITRALTLVLPTAPDVPAEYASKLGLDGNEQSYLDLLKVKDQAVSQTQAAIKRHGNNVERYSKDQQQAAMLAFYFAKIEATGQQNDVFRIIPAFLSDAREWHAPWALLEAGQGSPEGKALLKDWQTLAVAYLKGDANTWQTAAAHITDKTQNARDASDMQLSLEVWYHQLDPVLLTMLCYSAAFILLVLIMLKPSSSQGANLQRAASLLLSLGVLIHTLLIITRMVILERPPVATLYESVLFVALISVLLAWKLDKNTKSQEGKLIATLLGVLLIGISGLFADKGDSLGVLVAVLNTNFWLATHVVVITMGYGCALVVGSLAHIYLFKHSESIRQKLKLAALIALLFTAIGTILGGIWADQSWGRFWGWDPKENGALAIVIWLVWLLHGRITGHLGDIGFAACLCLTNIVVALSWFGVNLLSVGLHSYGFTDSAAYGLAAFCLAELALIIGLTIRAKRSIAHAC